MVYCDFYLIYSLITSTFYLICLQALAEKRCGIFDHTPFFIFLNGLLNRRNTSAGELSICLYWSQICSQNHDFTACAIFVLFLMITFLQQASAR